MHNDFCLATTPSNSIKLPIMPRQKPIIRAGARAKCSIFTRFLHPKLQEYSDQKEHRSTVVLISQETMKVNRKMIDCYTCSVDGIDDTIFHAAKTHFKMEKARERRSQVLTGE